MPGAWFGVEVMQTLIVPRGSLSGFIDLRPPFGERSPAQEYSFSVGLLVYHYISILETAMYKALFFVLFCFFGGRVGWRRKLCPIPTLLASDMRSASPEMFCLLSYRQLQGP